MKHAKRSVCLVAVTLLCLPSLVSASSFTPAEGAPLPPEVEAVLSRAQPGEDVVYIDDMAFRVDNQNRSGFHGVKWPDGVVFYSFDANVDAANRGRWLAGAQVWSNVANLRFVERTTEANYIHVQSSATANNSYVGMVGGRQVMNIHNWTYQFIIAHEIGHALGLMHEQSRSDRDTYVNINYHFISSVCGDGTQSCDYNFFRDDATTNYGPYDFESIMHYSPCSFDTGNCPPNYTIEAQPAYAAYQALMGNRSYLGPQDGPGMAAHYGAAGMTACDAGIVHDDGSFESGWGYDTSGFPEVGIVELFTPPDYPWNIAQVCVAFSQTNGDTAAEYEVVAFADDGPGGQPGTFLGSVPASMLGIPGWPDAAFYSADSSALLSQINEGSVYIGARWDNTVDLQLYMAMDTSVGTAQQFGYDFSGSTFYNLESAYADYQAMAIRVGGSLVACQADAYEPNNNGAPTTLIGLGDTQVHSICPAGDEDYLQFTLPEQSGVVIETSGNVPSDDTVLKLQDSSFVTIETNDDISSPLNKFSRIDRVCGVDPLEAGVYIINVNDSFADDQIVQYAVSLTAIPCTVNHLLSVNSSGTGSGTVTSFPGGIDCGSDCTEIYPQGTAVTLTATADFGSQFAGWTGSADCSDNVVTMSADTACTATFSLAACQSDEFENTGQIASDDSCWGAPIGIGSPQSHTLCDDDWVYFNATAGVTYAIETANLTGGADTMLELWQDCTTLVTSDDNGGSGMGSRIVWTATVSGVVDVRISEVSSYGDARAYDISVSTVSQEIFAGDFESGNMSGWSSVAP